ncbi:MAG: 4Fe-4S binding protein [Clostridiaceae bacterium]|nr:4Fe-4S binding protein [Clostridiaceae bacterium]
MDSEEKGYARRNTIFTVLRYLLLAVVLIFVSAAAFIHVAGNKLYPTIHAICPIGGVETLYYYITNDGATLPKVFSGTIGLLIITVVVAIIFRRAFCGLICPFGTLQEIFGNIGRRVFKKRFTVPAVVDRPLRYFKYVVLVAAILGGWLSGTLWLQNWDPWTAYAHIPNTSEIMGTYFIGLIVLVVVLLGSFFYERFFCKYACPLGALNSILGLLSRLRIARDKDLCINCGLCSKSCPVQIDVENVETVTTPECIDCGKCVAACPVNGALEMKFLKFRVNSVALLALVFVVFFGGITALQWAGFDRYSHVPEATLREIAKQEGLSVAAYKELYDLPEKISARARARDVEYSIPFYKIAELTGIKSAKLKEELGLSSELDNNTPWGDAYGEVSLGRIAQLNGTTVDYFKIYYGLDDAVGPDSKWKLVRDRVQEVLDEQRIQESCGGCGGE